MGNARTIWNHEVNQADTIARGLLKVGSTDFGWEVFFIPSRFLRYLRSKRELSVKRKNILFTKKLAFNAAKEIYRGNDRAHEMGLIVMKTRKILDKDKKGAYTEQVRRRQMNEIEWLMDHYLRLFNSNGETYEESLRGAYSTKNKYLTFLQRLHKLEQEVRRASLGLPKKGRKKIRPSDFGKTQVVYEKVRNSEAKSIYK